MRTFASIALLSLVGCSFVDDFDKFHAGDRDASLVAPFDAQTLDAGRGGGDDGAQPGDAASAPDGAGPDGAGDAALPGIDCAAAVDGTRCGDGLICRFKVCVASACGDGFIDAQRGEECEELNQVRGDGCEPTSCTFSCDQDQDCDDARLCNGKERCDLTTHRCSAGLPASVAGQACTTASNVSGACQAGLCVPAGCGNGTVDPGELCEPAMAGCRADCQPGCKADADCRNDDLCDGEESCDMATRECRAGEKIDCVDDDACTVNGVCAPMMGCRFQLIDEDRDGYSPAACAAASGRMADCNDANANVWPGAGERCDAIDNDCDGQIDEGVLLRCYADRDGDGYPTRDEVRTACSCPAGSLAVQNPATFTDWDCWDEPLDQGASVHPGQTAWFEDGYGPGGRRERSFDFNCDGQITPRYAALDAQGCTGVLGLVCDAKQGFQRAAPSCGDGDTYVVCASGTLVCEARTQTRKQSCH